MFLRSSSNVSVYQTTIASGKLGGEIIRKEGLSVLTKGMGVFSFKRFCDWTTRYLFVEIVQHYVRVRYALCIPSHTSLTLLSCGSQGDDPTRQLGTVEKALCALAGGTLSALATVPIDVMVATIQDAGKSGKKVSVAATLKNQFASGGAMETVRFSTRGLFARVAHVALTTLMMKTVTSAVYDQLFPREL